LSVLESQAFSAPQSTSVRFTVREATAAAHARLDKGLGRLDLAREHGYRQFLTIIAPAHLALEALLKRSGIGSIVPDWSERSRSAALRRDLAALGEAVEPLDLDIDDVHEPFALGILYALEGSRLGGRYLLRAVKAGGGDRPVEFLEHGDSHLWGSFCAMLEASPQAHAHLDDVIAGAHYAFAAFERSARESFDGDNHA
jgi:heme oxygenase